MLNGCFYSLLGMLGILTICSDIFQKKIRNIHLILISVLAIILYVFFIITGDLKISAPLLINPVAALITGFLLYITRLWKAGDAKLFATYSLLIPANNYASFLYLSCAVIFVNTFIISFIYMLPALVKDIISNKEKLRKKILSRKTINYLITIIGITLAISWVIQPILQILPLKNLFFLEFIILYFGYLLIFKFVDKIKDHKSILITIFATGLLLRYRIRPESFQINNLFCYIKHILQYSLILYLIRIVIEIEGEKSKRVPLAPFMFLGAILANTAFLLWIIKLLTFIR